MRRMLCQMGADRGERQLRIAIVDATGR